MKIEKNTAVTLRYKVTDLQGKVLEESKEPMVYLHGGYGNTSPRSRQPWTARTRAFRPRWNWHLRMLLASAMRRWCRPFPKPSFLPE